MTLGSFEPTHYKAWLALAEQSGSKEALNDVLQYKPEPGIRVPAYATPETGFEKTPVQLSGSAGFEVCLPVPPDFAFTRTSLMEGVDAFAGAWHSGWPEAEKLPGTLHLELMVKDLQQERLGDLLGKKMGTLTFKDSAQMPEHPEELLSLLNQIPSSFRGICIDLRSAEGAVAALTFAIEKTIKYFELLQQAGNSARDLIFFRIKTTEDFYLNLSVLRALRQVWLNILKHFNAPLCEPFVLAESPRLTLKNAESEQNIIRATSMAVSTMAGGASAFIIDGIDDIKGQSEGFGLRMTRNLQLILKEESMAGWVPDPSRGAYFMDALTRNLAETAWNQFVQSNP